MNCVLSGRVFELEGVIFDLDGTLLDSMSIWENMPYGFLHRKGLAVTKDAISFFLTGMPSETAEKLIREYALTDEVSDLADEINQFVEHAYFHSILLKNHTLEMLAFFRENNVKMAIATASDKYLVDAICARTGIAPFIDGIATCTEVGSGKYRPDVYEEALSLLGVAKEKTIVMEDAYYAIQTAKSAGFCVVAMEDASMRHHKAAIMTLADDYITDAKYWYEKQDHLYQMQGGKNER